MRKKLIITTVVLLSILIIMIVSTTTSNVWAGKKDKDKYDDDDYSDYSYKYKYKFDKDGSFKYKYEFDFGNDDEKYFTEQRAYEIGYQAGQVDRISNLPFGPTAWLHFEGKKLVNAYEEGYKDGYYSNVTLENEFLGLGSELSPEVKYEQERMEAQKGNNQKPNPQEEEKQIINLCVQKLNAEHLPALCQNLTPDLKEKVKIEAQKLGVSAQKLDAYKNITFTQPQVNQDEYEQQGTIEFCAKRVYYSNHLPPFCEKDKEKIDIEVQKLKEKDPTGGYKEDLTKRDNKD